MFGGEWLTFQISRLFRILRQLQVALIDRFVLEELMWVHKQVQIRGFA